jgi:hypothetical protein
MMIADAMKMLKSKVPHRSHQDFSCHPVERWDRWLHSTASTGRPTSNEVCEYIANKEKSNKIVNDLLFQKGIFCFYMGRNLGTLSYLNYTIFTLIES